MRNGEHEEDDEADVGGTYAAMEGGNKGAVADKGRGTETKKGKQMGKEGKGGGGEEK